MASKTTGAGQRQGENDDSQKASSDKTFEEKTGVDPNPPKTEDQKAKDADAERTAAYSSLQRVDGSLTDEQKDAQRAFESDDIPEGEAQALALEAWYSQREDEYAASDAASPAARKISEREVANRPEDAYGNPNKPPRKAQLGWDTVDERDNS